MRDNALEIKGLEELREALKKLPPELVTEGGAIVQAHAAETARLIEASYPVGPTGNLKSHVVMDVQMDAVSSVARVRSTAKHAWWHEYGTQKRAWLKTSITPGAAPHKNVGKMLPHKNTASFVDIAVRRRALMTAALIELVERAGLTVTGR